MNINELNLKSLDITGAEFVEIHIKADGKVIWINTETHCVLRICQIENLKIIDDREAAAKEPKVLFGGR